MVKLIEGILGSMMASFVYQGIMKWRHLDEERKQTAIQQEILDLLKEHLNPKG